MRRGPEPPRHRRARGGNGTVHFSDSVIRYVWSEPGKWPEGIHVQRVAAADQAQHDPAAFGCFRLSVMQRLLRPCHPGETAFRGSYLLEVKPESGDVGDRQLALPSFPP